MILRTKDLTKAFGSLKAVDGVNIEIKKGTIHSIIGPNGAGKTTFFNMLTGNIPVSSGEIYFQNKNITNLKPHEISRTGISRSFQQNNMFKNLSVLENVRLSAHAHTRGRYDFIRDYSSFLIPIERASKIIEELEIDKIATQKAGDLSHGEQRTLEIAIALATDPILLLLDEPTSGMSPIESLKMLKLIKKLGKSFTIVVIEHNINLVWAISTVVTVLHQGQVIASGVPEEIGKNEEVQKAYLGGKAL